MNVPTEAKLQWLKVGSALAFLYVIGLFVVPFTILFSRKMTNQFGETVQTHSTKYIEQGSSGQWDYIGCNVPFLQWFSNLEDGNLGEPSGKHSARAKGKERSFWWQYYWLALRNPSNYIKRTHPFFHCVVDECHLTWAGDFFVDDKGKNWGKQLVTAKHLKTGKVYYGFYSAEKLDDQHCRVKRYGFKIKPSHAGETQDADDKDKAFTFRYQHRARVN